MPFPFLLACFLLGSGAAPAETSATRAVEQRLQGDVTRLASDAWQGRRAGSAGADLAADWIAEELGRAGLEPGAQGGWFQEFSFIDGIDLGPGSRMGVPGGPQWRAGEAFRPLALSAAGAARGEVVFAGYGIVAPDLGYDDYQGVDASGRVVLVLRYGPGGDDPQSRWAAFTALRFKAAAARDHGAKALLVVTGPRTPGAKDELVPLRTDASLADAGLPAFTIAREVADALLARAGTSLEAAQRRLDESARPAAFVLTGVEVDAVADLAPKRSRTRNVVGLLRAPGPQPEAVVVGAHYDHLGLGPAFSLDPAPEGKVHHGADDNASGTAAMLALARSLAERRLPLRRSVLFVAFGAEELGLLGSSHFVKNPPLPLERIAAMVNMDMIGRLREDAVQLHGTGTSPLWKPLLEEANRGVGLKLQLHDGGHGPSDHTVFYTAGKPVLAAFTGNHADYHRPSDTADKVDTAGVARVLSLLEPVVAALATREEPIGFTRVAADAQPPAAHGPASGARPWVGGIPDYSEEGAGVRFSGASPGSPAEKAGLRGGDLLVRFDGKEIRNIYDYTYALGARKPGDAVTLVVRREGAELRLTLTLGVRPGEAR